MSHWSEIDAGWTSDEEPTASEVKSFMDLPDHVQEHIMSFCDVRTKLNLSETCTYVNRLLFSSPKLIDRVKLSINNRYSQDVIGLYFITIMANRRKYQNLEIKAFNYELSTLFFSFMETMSTSVKQLVISERLEFHHYTKILKIFNNTEKLNLQVQTPQYAEQFLKIPKLMPNLKELEVSRESTIYMIKLFEDVTSLTHLKLYVNHQATGILKTIENFILQQSGLKHLTIKGYGILTFPVSALNRADFLLEYLEINETILDRRAAQFFKKQTNLKTVKIDKHNCHRNADPETVKTMLTLPKLQSLDIGKCIETEDLVVLSGINNPSVLKLTYSGKDSVVLEALISYFPNITKIKFSLFDLKLKNTPCEKLVLMEPISPRYSLQRFSYQPSSSVITNEGMFKDILIGFLCSNKQIVHLTIGHFDWIENNFKLSVEILLAIAFLKRLQTVVIYNPMEITTLIELLGSLNVYAATIYTSAAGMLTVAARQPLEKLLGSRLRIIEVEV